MKITRTVGAAIIAATATLQMVLVSAADAGAAPRRDLGFGYYEVGAFADITACSSDRTAQQATYNLGTSDCYQLDGGWYYKGRVGA